MDDIACSSEDCCAICLQTAELPIVLPCFHKFCFLCAKGAALRDLRCALCRTAIPREILFNPRLNVTATTLVGESPVNGHDDSDRYVWFYEGHNGWWRYDERNCTEIEQAFVACRPFLELLLAGNVYVISFQKMVQYRKSDPSRRRRIKRDFLKSSSSKGVAGVKVDGFDTADRSTESPTSNSAVERIADNFTRLTVTDHLRSTEQNGDNDDNDDDHV